jgi:prolyl-tRNA synthetase
MRTREFVMKDLYSFCHTQKEQEAYYEKVKEAYVKIFKRLGIGDTTYVTFASGGIFSKYSHEFQTICDNGEDEIYISDEKNIAINKEVMNEDVYADLGVSRSALRMSRASEVGNIFNLGTRFSEALGLDYTDEEGKKHPVWMGSYGLGPARIMGVMVEKFADDKGLVWPEAVAPFSLHLISLSKEKNDNAHEQAEMIYEKLTHHGVPVLFDDRDATAGEKFADSDLLGIPMRVVVSEKSLKAGGVEIKERKSDKSEIISLEEFINSYSNGGKCAHGCDH